MYKRYQVPLELRKIYKPEKLWGLVKQKRSFFSGKSLHSFSSINKSRKKKFSTDIYRHLQQRPQFKTISVCSFVISNFKSL